MRRIIGLALMLIVPLQLAADTLLIIPDGGKPYTIDTVTGDKNPLDVDGVYVDKGYGGGSTPDEDIPDAPDDTPDSSELRSQVKQWAADVDDTAGARIFAAMFDVLGDRIESGEVPADSRSIDNALTNAVEVAVEHFPRGSDPDDWKKVKRKIQDEVAKIAISKGGDLSQKEWLSVFRDIQYGFEDTYEGEAIPIWLAPILNALIEALISMLRNLF